jgi:hypothetical protein
MPGKYIVVSGLIFGLIAVLQAARALLQLPVRIGSFSLPVLASWVVAVVSAGLCVWAFRSMKREQP